MVVPADLMSCTIKYTCETGLNFKFDQMASQYATTIEELNDELMCVLEAAERQALSITPPNVAPAPQATSQEPAITGLSIRAVA